jgi:hypothetical protein
LASVQRNAASISQREAGHGDPQQRLGEITPVGQSTRNKNFESHANTPTGWCHITLPQAKLFSELELWLRVY